MTIKEFLKQEVSIKFYFTLGGFHSWTLIPTFLADKSRISFLWLQFMATVRWKLVK